MYMYMYNIHVLLLFGLYYVGKQLAIQRKTYSFSTICHGKISETFSWKYEHSTSQFGLYHSLKVLSFSI